MTRKTLISLFAAAVVLTACQTTGAGQKQTAGTLIGGAAGAVAGAQFGDGRGQLAMTAIGTLVGAFVGSEVGASLDRADRLYAQRAAQQAHHVPVGSSVTWSNPDTGHYGSVTPTREGRDYATGAYCREYQTTVVVGGRERSAYGTACLQPDGSWAIVDSS